MKIKIPQNTALILDSIAIIQQLANYVPAIFGDLSIYVLRYIIKLASFYILSRVDFVCDKYNPLSIKNSERRLHSISSGYWFCGFDENKKKTYPVSEIPRV